MDIEYRIVTKQDPALLQDEVNRYMETEGYFPSGPLVVSRTSKRVGPGGAGLPGVFSHSTNYHQVMMRLGPEEETTEEEED